MGTDARWMDIEAISNIEVLPEETLRRIAKGSLTELTLECDDFEKVHRLWQCLFKTFSTASISHDHTTTSCNTLSAFLDAAIVSKREETRQLALHHETWLSVFEVFLDRFEDSKPKPMKQVLTSLVKVLAKQRQEDGSGVIVPKIVDKTIPSIVLGEPRSRRKPSLVSLEVFIRKNAILPGELISMVEGWLLKNNERWVPVLQDDCVALTIDVSKFKNRGLSDCESKATAAKILILGLLSQAKNADFASSAGSTIAVFFQKLKAVSDKSDEEARSLVSTWVTPVKQVMLQNLDGLEFMSNQILYPLFSIDTRGFHCFIDNLPYKTLLAGDMFDASSEEFMLLFTALQGAKKIGLVHEDSYFSKAAASKQSKENPFIVKSEVIGQCLLHREPSIRIAALSLLVTAATTTKPVTSAAMRAILKGLPAMHADPDPYSRGEILSLTRKLIVRLKGGIVSYQNDQEQSTLTKNDSETWACLTAYIDFLKTDLQPTASYPRHTTALKALKLFLESGLDSRVYGATPIKTDGNEIKWKFDMEIFNSAFLRLLVDLLLDPFEEVRATSLSLVNLFPREILLAGLQQNKGQAVDTVLQLTTAVDRAEKLASNTSRADHADTVARLYHLLFCAAASGGANRPGSHWWETKAGVVDTILKKLEEKLSIAGGLFNSSMRDAPLHGYVSGLRYIILMPNFYSLISDQSDAHYTEWVSVHARIVSICDRIWDEVKPVLCVDSPEGHTDEPTEDLMVGPKDILSYSWRALRESSLLLYATLSNANYGPQGGQRQGLKRHDYEKIGNASFAQLAELRHRGAFSTVSQTFATCCQRCGQSKDAAISSLPDAWYQEANKIIFETASKLTRRSAGLPALVTGILTSKPGSPLFRQVMNDLHAISRLPAKHDKSKQEMELPQVHAMNCLKDIFTNTKLGPHTVPFIMSALNLSAERLGSPIWALRNSGLMLFRALLSRMCRLMTGSNLGFGGNSGSEPGARISFQKYPGLVQLLSSLLAPTTSEESDGGQAMLTERVFPALELIGEKVPTHPGEEDFMLRRLVREQLKSPVWGIREHAARVYASLLNRSDILGEVRTILDIDQDVKAQNYIHGKALCIRYALRRLTSSSLLNWRGQIDEIVSIVRVVFATLFPVAQSPFVATALIGILTDIAEKSVEVRVIGNMASFLDELFEIYDFQDILEYVFDSSHPSWRALSTTRASSLLRRVLSWVELLRIFGSGRFDRLKSFFQTVSTFDSNTGRWLLEKTQDLFSERKEYEGTLLNLYAIIILGDYSADVKGAAILNLATLLEILLDFRHDNIKGIDLPWTALSKQLESDAEAQTRSRDTADAELRLHGCLLAGEIISSQQALLTYEVDLSKWAARLRFAMQEETEFTTRHAAVASLATFGRVLRPLGSPPRVDHVFLDVYLVLYDMLNDDDDELRDIAASVASWILSYSSVSLSKAVALSPLNAANLLAEFIARSYPDSKILFYKTVRYTTGQEPRISGSIDRTTLVPVSHSMSELRKESTILFVEEKQNLFIDEVREVHLWPQKLLYLSENAFDGPTVKNLFTWVSGGLEYLINATVDDAGKDGLLGWTSKPEIFALGMRVINIAAVLVSRQFPGLKCLGEDCRGVVEGQLRSLLNSGEKACLHQDWIGGIQGSIEGI